MKNLLLLLTCLSLTAQSGPLPEGWNKGGIGGKGYDAFTVDEGENPPVATLVSKKQIKDKEFGTIAQTFYPQEFLGKRIKMSARIKSGDIEKWAGAWLRIDGPLKETLAFDNMQERPILANKEWQEYEIVVDVPTNATKLLYGVLLIGNGQVWVDDFKFEVVDNKTNLTGQRIDQMFIVEPKRSPLNNGF